MQNKVKQIIAEIKETLGAKRAEDILPQNTFYLKDGKILAMPREFGESRFPYDSDGFVVWAYQTGFISACDSTFTILRSANYGEEPPVNFFGGIKKENGEFMPYSILGGARQLFEGEDVERYVVFSLRSVYYIVDTKDITFACRMNVSRAKDICFTVTAENKSADKKDIYITSFVEALLRFTESEGFWDRMSKFARRNEDGSVILWSRNGKEDCLVVNTKVVDGTVVSTEQTVGRSVFLGYKGRTIANAESLRTGKFAKEVPFVTTTDLPIASDIKHFALEGGKTARVEYRLTVRHGLEEAEKVALTAIDEAANEKEIEEWENEDKTIFNTMKVNFEDYKLGNINPAVMNKFVKNIQKQVSFCALGKNYAGPHIGIRDVFQQLEGSLMWDPAKSREKILVAMNYIMSNGRAPRQFSVPADPNAIPEFDLRMYIDQGVWIISTIYTYLSFTGDFSILDEECGYYDLLNEQWGSVAKSERRDSVLAHMINIMDFLASKLDIGNTWCMRALYGDWNDALDGLGRTKDEGKDYGDGVSVMTTLQYYLNLEEMVKMLSKLGGYEDKIKEYTDLREKVEAGLFKYAVDTNENGDKRVIHGWGDKMGYKVGSFNDFDGKERFSLAATSYWAISGIINKDHSMAKTIIDCADAVDSKYGLKTFSKPFKIEDRPYIGRLATIVEGTYENCCAYVHASMFGVMSLFTVGESKRAWEEMTKSIVITHDNCTMTSFVMPNSWCHNDKLYIDGVSMGDWYTGSGTVFIKELIRFGFGIYPDLDGLNIQTPAYMPTDKAELTIKVKGHDINFSYENRGNGKRTFEINGKVVEGKFDELMKTEKLYIESADISDNMTITVID